MKSDLDIRLARPDERASLIALQRTASLMWVEDRAALLAEPDAIDLPLGQITEGHVFVAERAEVVRGFAVVLPRADGAAELDGLFVDSGHWREGVGRRLVAHAEGVARAVGARQLCVVSNKQAAGFYRACGFEVIGEVATRFSPGLAMGKAL